jgi:CheY-like chemotaxis protein
MDGLTCVRRIRDLQQQGVVHAHVPVIAVTANVRSEQVEVALKAGMDDVISKPFRIPELCACIRKTLVRLGER